MRFCQILVIGIGDSLEVHCIAALSFFLLYNFDFKSHKFGDFYFLIAEFQRMSMIQLVTFIFHSDDLHSFILVISHADMAS